jgi:hypothetical protein
VFKDFTTKKENNSMILNVFYFLWDFSYKGCHSTLLSTLLKKLQFIDAIGNQENFAKDGIACSWQAANREN